MKFVVLKSRNGKFYFVIKSSNGQIVANSEMYEQKASALKTIDSIKARINDETPIEDLSHE